MGGCNDGHVVICIMVIYLYMTGIPEVTQGHI